MRALLDPNHSAFFQSGFILSRSEKPGDRIQLASLSSTEKDAPIFAPSFFSKHQESTIRAANLMDIARSDLLRACEGPSLDPLTWSAVNWREFEKDFLDFQWEASQGNLKKAVLFASQSGPPPSVDRIRFWLGQLLLHTENYPVWIYGFWNEEGGILGATPELLFERKGDQLTTMALAGTQKPGFPSLQSDPKEMQEHALVVEALCESLGKDRTQVGELQLRAAGPTLQHLFTPIRAKIPESLSTEALIQALHPTPALGGVPRETALRFLAERERGRGRFGAPFGLAEQMVVAIRGIQWDREKSWITAGAGILPQSILTTERYELMMKLRSIRKSFSEDASS